MSSLCCLNRLFCLLLVHDDCLWHRETPRLRTVEIEAGRLGLDMLLTRLQVLVCIVLKERRAP